MRVAGVFLIIILIGVGLVYVMPKSDNTPDDNVAVQSEQVAMKFSDVQEDIQNGAILLDVRTRQEYDAGRFKNAALHPVQKIEAGVMPDVKKDAKLYVYCRSGNRSSQAKQLLNDAGYSNVIDLGGLSEVEAIGGELEG